MAEYKIPPFLKRNGEALLYNGDGQLLYVIPEKFFETKCAYQYGSYYCIIGVFNYLQTSKTGAKIGKVKPLNYPTMFMCKPSLTQMKVSGVELNKKFGSFDDDTEYRILYFNKGDEVVHSVFTPELLDHVEEFFRMFFITGKIGNTIPYDKMHEYFKENINLNGNDYHISAQMYGIIISETCRDKDNVSIPFRNGKNIDTDMHGFKTISVKENPNYIDPYVSLTSEQWDESLMSAIMLKDDKNSPLEKIMTT